MRQRHSKRAEEALLWGHLLAVNQLVSRELAAALDRDVGIPLNWYEVLLSLSFSPAGRLRLQEIEKACLQSQSGLTRLIDRMETAGHVVKEPAAEDGRGVYARITPAGSRVFKRAAATYVAAIHSHFLGHMSQEEKRVVSGVLQRVRDALQPGEAC